MRSNIFASIFVLAILSNIKVNAGCNIAINANSTQPVCTASNGSIALVPSNGSAPYRYHWSTGATTVSISHIAASNYTVTVTDALGCTASRTLPLTSYIRSFNVSATAVADTCAAHIGKVTATVNSGGNAPFKYFWSNSGSSSPITGLGAHYYSVIVTDSNGCSASAGASVTTVGTPITVTGIVTQPVCYGNKGSISISATGGTSSHYTALWSNGSTGFGAANLQGGSYWVTVSGTNGCNTSKSFTITAPDSIKLQYHASGVKCDSGIGGSITNTSITGASYPWTAAWTGPLGYTSNSVSINRLSAGQYHLHLTDAKGCTANSNYTVDSTGALKATYSASSVYCNGNNGAITYQALTPFSNNAVYRWTGSNNFTSTNKSISNLGPGTYNITVTEDFGCNAKSSYTLSNTFDIGVSYIRYINDPTAGMKFTIHPLAGDVSQHSGQHCAAGVSGQVQMIVTGPVKYIGTVAGGLIPTSIHGDTINWSIADFGSLNMDSSFFAQFLTDSNAVPGDQACIHVNVTPVSGDIFPANNTANSCLTILRPYDPNEKQVYPDGRIEPTQKQLTYTVHFQNTGTAPAQNVYVLDTIDTHLDVNSFKVTASSYPVQPVVIGNAVRFNFAGINLPDSSVDAAGSRGWVQYTVDLRENLPLGTQINNTAYIYFDFNSPIVTNTTNNYIGINVNNTSTPSPVEFVGTVLYPNPAHHVVQIKTDKDAVGGRLEITDAVGRSCNAITITGTSFTLPLSNFAQGLYLVNMISSTGKITTQKLIVE